MIFVSCFILEMGWCLFSRLGNFKLLPIKPRGLQVLMPKPNVLIMLLRSGVEPKELDLNL